MEIQEFINHFSEQFDDADSNVFAAETIFRNLDEWSSLQALSIIAMVDEEYGKKLTGDDIQNSETIGDLFKIVQSK